MPTASPATSALLSPESIASNSENCPAASAFFRVSAASTIDS